MILAQKHNVCDFIVEEEAFEGVKRIAEKVAADVELVCGLKPEIRGNAPAQADACVERSDALSTLRKELHNSSDPVVAFAAKDYFEFKIL